MRPRTDARFVTRTVGPIAILLLALALAACTSAPTPTADPGLEVGLVPTSVSLPRGGDASVEVRIERRGGLTGAVEVTPGEVPAGIEVTSASLAEDATRATLALTAGADLAPGERTLTLVASAGELVRSAELTVRVTAPSPSVTQLRVRDTDDSTQLRQGEGLKRLVVEGVDLDTVSEASLGGLAVTIEGEPDADTLTLTVTVPNGAELGPRDLVLGGAGGDVTVTAAVEVVPLTAGPDGSDTDARGTPDDPFRSMRRALELAQEGDVVLLLAGTYGTASGETFPTQTLLSGAEEPTFSNVPDGVTIRGEGPAATVLERTGDELPTLVAFAPAGDLRLESLSVVGFGHAVSATTGQIELVDVHVRDGSNGIRAVSQANLRLSGSTRIEDAQRGLILGGAATASLEGTIIDNARFFGVTMSGEARLETDDALIRRSSYGLRLAGTAIAQLRDTVIEQPPADAGLGVGILAEERAVLELRGSTVQRFQFGVGAGGQRLLMRDTTIRENAEVGLVIPNVEPRPTWQPARVYDLGTASEPGGNVLVDNGDYQLVDGRPSGARQQLSVSATVIGPDAPSTLVLTGPLDDPPRWTIVNAGVQIAFW